MRGDKTILSVDSLQVAFVGEQRFKAVNKVSFLLQEGKTLAIVGESGSGKSLTALSLMGLLPKNAVQTGNIKLNTEEGEYTIHRKLHDTTWQHLRGNEIGMIFQEPMSSLNPVKKIGYQLSEVIRQHQKITEGEARQKSIDWLRKVKLRNAEAMYSRYPHELSGGQKQRVMIAMAMCNNPVLLIADEPTTALDVTVQQEIVKLMKRLQEQQGTAMIFITHDLALAANIADEVLVMYKGEVAEYGPAQRVLESPKHDYTKALLACRPTPEHKGRKLSIVADFMEGTEAAGTNDERQDTIIKDENLLEVNDLKVWFSVKHNWLGKTTEYFKAVNDVSFNIKKGEVLGLVGESGCGKSTISRSLMGLLPIHEGQILYNNEDLAKLNSRGWKKIRKQIQLIFQDPYASLNPRMSIGDTLIEPLAVHNIVPRSKRRKEALRLLDLVHLPADSMKRYPHQFSGGQRQRISIARALAVRPELLICDESVSALDVSVQAQILNLLKELQTEFGLSYLFISHDLNVVHYISDRVMVMQDGKFVESGRASEVLRNPLNEYTKKLVAAIP